MKKLLFFVLLASCSQVDHGSSMKSIAPKIKNLNVIKNINVNISDGIPYNFERASILSGQDSLSLVGLFENNLYFFDLIKEEFAYSIDLINHQPTTLDVADFYVHSMDSIYILDQERQIVVLTNSQGFHKEIYRLREILGSIENFGWIDCNRANRFKYDNDSGSFILYGYPPLAPNDPELYEYAFVITIDQSLESHDVLKLPYPSTYETAEGYYPIGMYFHTSECNEEVLYSFPNDNGIYKYDASLSELRLITSVKSNFTEVNRVLKRDHDYQEEENYVNTSGFSFKASTDNSCNYYRIVKHSQLLKDSEGLLNPYGNSSWSIIKTNLDKPEESFEYQISNQFKLSESYLVGDNIFLLSKEKENNSENTEELLQFDLVELR